VDIIITGAEEFGVLARHLKQAGSPNGLRKELYAGLNQATRPLKQAAKASAASRLPHRGGLAQRVARSRLSTRSRSGGTGLGIRIEAKGMDQLALIDRGTVRHPVYGRPPFVTQSVTPLWFTAPMWAGAPLVREELVQAIRRVAAKIEAGI